MGATAYAGGNRLMATHGAMDRLCVLLRDILGRKICNECSLTEPKAGMQKLREAA